MFDFLAPVTMLDFLAWSLIILFPVAILSLLPPDNAASPGMHENFPQTQQSTSTEESQAQTKSDIVAHLLHRISMLEQASQVPQSPRISIKEPKISSPKSFSGSKTEARAFIEKCDNVFHLQPHTYASEDAKISFTVNLLEGEAYCWFQPYLEIDINTCPAWTHTWSLFKVEFIKQFGDSNIIKTSHAKLKHLKQTGSASHYTTEFKHHATYLGWDDNALCQTYFDGLKEDVKYRILTPQAYTTFESLAEDAIRWDNLLFQHRKSTNTSAKASTPVTCKSQPPPVTITLPREPQHTPMDIDSLRFKRLTPEERQTHINKKLCLYCGKPGHMACDCRSHPQQSQTSKANTTMSQSKNTNPQAQ